MLMSVGSLIVFVYFLPKVTESSNHDLDCATPNASAIDCTLIFLCDSFHNVRHITASFPLPVMGLSCRGQLVLKHLRTQGTQICATGGNAFLHHPVMMDFATSRWHFDRCMATLRLTALYSSCFLHPHFCNISGINHRHWAFVMVL